MSIGITIKEVFRGAKGANNYWIAERTWISLTKFITYNGEHSLHL